jgi:phosphoglycolate phosphatase-like HAD superfamily hydrolase
MPPSTVICDWNGTLIEYRNEGPLFDYIATALFRASVPFHPLRMARILRTRRILANLEQDHDSDHISFVRELFQVYNEGIIRGTPVSLLHIFVDHHARRARTQTRLDYRVLNPIRGYHEAGHTTGILSAGYRYGIERILAVAGLGGHFDFCVADRLDQNGGKAIGFKLELYARKHEFLLDLLNERGLDPRAVAYIGDSEDDEGCFQVVGYPIVSFLAPEPLKARFAAEYSAFVPSSERDLSSFLGIPPSQPHSPSQPH